MGPYASYLLQTVVMLAAVSALALGVTVLARRAGLGRREGPIELVGRLPLDARRALYLVRVGSRVFLVGAGEGGLSRLGELSADDVPAAPAPPDAGLGALFARALERARKTARPGDREAGEP